MDKITGQTVYLLITILPTGEAACSTFASREARDRECAAFIADWLYLVPTKLQPEIRELLARELIPAALWRFNKAVDYDRQITCLDSEVMS
jgi:hypothetical protein